MFVIVWRFVPKRESMAAFERTYGPKGDWAQLFGKAKGYKGTRLLREHGTDVPPSYLVVDAWQSRADFDAFKADSGEDYVLLDIACEQLTHKEEKLGEFEEVE